MKHTLMPRIILLWVFVIIKLRGIFWFIIS